MDDRQRRVGKGNHGCEGPGRAKTTSENVSGTVVEARSRLHSPMVTQLTQNLTNRIPDLEGPTLDDDRGDTPLGRRRRREFRHANSVTRKVKYHPERSSGVQPTVASATGTGT